MDARARDVAMALAEDAHQPEWANVGFTAEVFKAGFRRDLMHPFPAQSPEDGRIDDEYIETIRPVIEQSIDPWQIDADDEYPREALDTHFRLVMPILQPKPAANLNGRNRRHLAHAAKTSRLLARRIESNFRAARCPGRPHARRSRTNLRPRESWRDRGLRGRTGQPVCRGEGRTQCRAGFFLRGAPVASIALAIL